MGVYAGRILKSCLHCILELHNCFEFSQLPLCLDEAILTEKVLFCLITIHQKKGLNWMRKYHVSVLLRVVTALQLWVSFATWLSRKPSVCPVFLSVFCFFLFICLFVFSYFCNIHMPRHKYKLALICFLEEHVWGGAGMTFHLLAHHQREDSQLSSSGPAQTVHLREASSLSVESLDIVKWLKRGVEGPTPVVHLMKVSECLLRWLDWL